MQEISTSGHIDISLQTILNEMDLNEDHTILFHSMISHTVYLFSLCYYIEAIVGPKTTQHLFFKAPVKMIKDDLLLASTVQTLSILQ